VAKVFAGVVVPASALGGVFGDRHARVIVLRRRKELPCARGEVTAVAAATTSGPVVPASFRRVDPRRP